MSVSETEPPLATIRSGTGSDSTKDLEAGCWSQTARDRSRSMTGSRRCGRQGGTSGSERRQIECSQDRSVRSFIVSISKRDCRAREHDVR